MFQAPVQKIIQKEVKTINKDSEQKETTTTKKNEPPKLDKNALEKGTPINNKYLILNSYDKINSS